MSIGSRPITIAAALLVLVPPPLAAAADHSDWGTEKSELTSGSNFARSKAVCRRLGRPDPPALDRPTPSQTKALKGCSSEKLYYGEGVRPDYVKARLCAFVEADGADGAVFGGSAILMQIYANGLGVPRNPDLATAYACRVDGAPAEINGRVLHMQALETRRETGPGTGPQARLGRIDYCDDITSGLAEGYCQSRASDQAAVGRDGRLAALRARLSPAARASYPAMKRAFDTFVEAHGDGEVDLSGTARAAMVIDEQDSVRDQFVRDLQRLLTGRWPAGTPADARAADGELNASYRKALLWAGGHDNASTIKPDGIRKAQRAWLAYRDAFAAFAAQAALNVKVEAVLTRVTKLRTAQLDQLTG